MLMAGYALAAEDTSPGRVQRLFEVCAAPPCSCDVRSFSSFEPTMTSADFCPVTPHVTARRAVQTGKSDCVFARFGSGQSPQPSALFASGTARPGRSSLTSSTPHAKQIPPGRCANCQCTSAAFTVGCVPLGFAAMCQLASHPSALTMRFAVRRLAPLALGLPPDDTSRCRPCRRLVVIMLTMSPCRHSHRGLAPHKFAPMLGAHPSFERTRYGRPLQAFISFSALRALPPRAAQLKRWASQ